MGRHKKNQHKKMTPAPPRYIPLYDEEALQAAGILISPHTLRKWRYLGRYPEMFTKLGGIVMVDREAYEKIAEEEKRINE